MLALRLILEEDDLQSCAYGPIAMAYYRQIQTHDFHVWTKDEVAYYKRYALPFKMPYNRFTAFNSLIEPLKERNPFLASKLGNFTEVNHWWSIVSTRNFAINHR